MAVQPGRTLSRSIVAAKKGRMLQIEFVQILHKAMEGVMYGVFQDIPILLPLLIPFPANLSELISHKVQLLAWMGVHDIIVYRHGPVETSLFTPRTFSGGWLLSRGRPHRGIRAAGRSRCNNSA